MEKPGNSRSVSLIAGAYPAAPVDDPWSKEDEETFWGALVDSPEAGHIDGLELAWQDGALHGHDEGWFLNRLPARWRHVVTTIPDTMISGRTDPWFGLASLDDAGRQRALEHARALRDRLDSISQSQGRAFAAAVEIHSAPLGHGAGGAVTSSGEAFRSSLAELTSWDWHGARILVEHCDAAPTTGAPAKGFLTLADELAAIDDVAGSGPEAPRIAINWGRSVIEGRSRSTAVEHVEHVSAAGSLGALMFSGVAAPVNDDAWLDNHLPFAELEPASLMRAADMRQCLDAAGGHAFPDLVGVKTTCRSTSSQPSERAADVMESVALVAAALTDRRG